MQDAPFLSLLRVGVVLALLFAPCVRAAVPADFTIHEHLGRNWTRECVTFDLSDEQMHATERELALVGNDGNEVRWQRVAGRDAIAVQLDLSAYGSCAFRFVDRPRDAGSPITIDDRGDMVEVTNGATGLRLRKRLADGEGPIAGVRLPSGTWTGDSTFTLTDGAAVESYEVRTVAAGAVFAELECRIAFGDGGHWLMRFRLERDEPVIRVDESYDAPSAGYFTLMMGGGDFRPTHMLTRDSRVESAVVRVGPMAGYLLEPWMHWNNPGHGVWLATFTASPPKPKEKVAPTGTGLLEEQPDIVDFSLEDKEKQKAVPPPPLTKADDMLVIGMLEPAIWRDPRWQGRARQTPTHVRANVRDDMLAVDFPVAGGRRAWLLGALDRRASEKILAADQQRVAPPPQRLVIKHGDFPLDKVRRFTLDWEGDDDNHPVLYVRRSALPELRKHIKSDPAELQRWKSQQNIDKYFLDGPIKEYFATSDKVLGDRMAAKALEYLDTCVSWYLDQDYLHKPGTAPHMQSLIITIVNLIDPVLSSDSFTPEQRKRALAKLAFIGYVVNSDDYWSPARGYSGFANMTSVVALYRTAIACLLPHHPESKAWAKQGLGQLEWQLTNWSDEDGGWVEAPHYAMVSFDHMLAGFTMAANAGLSDQLYAPRMRKVVEWFAAISTPRDSRTGGFRHQPPIGNTYHGEPNGLYGLIAAMYADRDPAFGSHMQWLHEQHGSFAGLGIGWNFPSMLGYRFLMNASGVEPKPADTGSQLFRNTGVVLRNTMQTDRETYLHLIAGHNRSHYDIDSGSIILYGKGRVLSDDWGYIGQHPSHWHSMLTSGDAPGGAAMTVDAFATSPTLDYVSGVKRAWRRQIAFMKDDDPLGPNYFVMRDTHAGEVPATWRLWLTALESPNADAPERPDISKTLAPDDDGLEAMLDETIKPDTDKPAPPKPGVTIGEHGATLIGGEDVDMDIFIFNADALNLQTETATQRATTAYRNGREGAVTNEQTALTATRTEPGVVAAVLYPRLKTQPRPKVTWSADGAVVRVETKAGVDTVFLTAPHRRTHEPDAGVLAPLLGIDRQRGATGYFIAPRDGLPASGDVPRLMVDPAKETFYLHPGPTVPITVVWRSPIDGSVSVNLEVKDIDAGQGNGILYALRKGDSVLIEGALKEGEAVEPTPVDNVKVSRGELLRLVIHPGTGEKAHWWDTTYADMTVTAADGTTWNLVDAIQKDASLGNMPDADRAKAVWWVCEGDAPTFAEGAFDVTVPTYSADDGKVRFTGTAAALRTRGGKTSLILGAAGSISTNGRTLESDEPTSR